MFVFYTGPVFHSHIFLPHVCLFGSYFRQLLVGILFVCLRKVGICESFYYTWLTLTCWNRQHFSPFPNKPWFLCVCCTSLLKTLWEKEKLLVMSKIFVVWERVKYFWEKEKMLGEKSFYVSQTLSLFKCSSVRLKAQ